MSAEMTNQTKKTSAKQGRGHASAHNGTTAPEMEADVANTVRQQELGNAATSPGPRRLSFSGDPQAESSVAAAIASADATGDPSLRPWTDAQVAPHARTTAIGAGLAALRARRTPEETALVREVSARITTYRETHGLSQSALATRLDMPQPALARLEMGLDTPTFDTLANLARVLGTTFAIEVTPEGIRLQ